MRRISTRGGHSSSTAVIERVEPRQLFSGSISQTLTPAAASKLSLHADLAPIVRTTMDNTLPAPTITAPGSGTTPGPVLTTNSPTFTWTAVTGVSSMTGYQLNLYDSTTAVLTSYQIGASATSYTLSTPLTAGHSYIWNLRIVAHESSGTVTGKESNYLYFQSAPAPVLPDPVVIGPGSTTSPGPVLTTLTPTFQWNATAGSFTGYQLNLYDSTKAVFTSYQIAASATSFTLPSGVLNAGDQYVWNLRVVNGTQTGGPSTYLYFQAPAASTPVTLPVPVILSPGNSTSPGPLLTTDNPTFTWNAVTGITGYQLNIHDSTADKSFTYTIASTATSFTPPSGTLTPGDSFVWNLRVLNGTASGSPSTYFYFQTPAAAALPVPTITSPGTSTSPGPLLTTDNPTFTWDAVTGITGYQLNIHDNTSNKSFSYTISPTATSFTPPAGTIAAGDSFVWNLRVLNGSASGAPSTYFYFQTPALPALPVPTIASPGNATSPGPLLTSANPTFTWTASTGITGYQLNVYDSTSKKSYSFTISPAATSFTAPTGTFTLGDDFVWNLRVLDGTRSGSPSTYFYFQLPAPSPATTLQAEIANYTNKLAHLDSEKHSLAKSMDSATPGTSAYTKLAKSYKSTSKEIKSIEDERATLESELDS